MLLNRYGYPLRHNGWLMGNVREIAQQELQGMIARGQFHGGFRLPAAEVQVVFIIDDRKVESRQFRVHQQLMVAAVVVLDDRPAA